MGIVHFAGLGRFPGAVTSGLSYLKHQYGDRQEYGQIVESVVLFTSPEVAKGEVEAEQTEYNDYMSPTAKDKWPRNKTNAVEIVTEFVKREMQDVPVYCCQVDVTDFSDCFQAVAKAILRFHPPGDVGKHIWANITGGTNQLNAALFQTAYLSGFISRMYYTFISSVRNYGKYLQPFSDDRSLFDFREIYVLKTAFDERFQQILEELDAVAQKDPQKWLTCQELLGRLKGKGLPGFQNMSSETFRRDFLHVMQGRGLQRKGNEDQVRLDPQDGPRILSILRSEYVQALFQRQTFSPEKARCLAKDLQISRC